MFEEDRLSKFETFWHGLIFWAVAFTAIEATFSFAFKTNIQTWQLWTDAIISLIFITDLFFNLKGLKESLKSKKRRNLPLPPSLFFILFIDVMACIPFDLITWAFSLENGIKMLALLRVFRMFRIIKIYSIVNSMTIVPKYIRMQILIVCSLIIVHWIACGWVLLYPPAGKDHVTYYVECLYWAITTLTTIGYGDITPTTTIARLYTMCIMILGVGLYGVVIGNVTRALSLADKHKEETQEKLADLGLFMKHYQVPKKLQHACFKYYQHIFQQQIGQNDQKIISDLPPTLQQELKNYMNVKLISELSIFHECSKACLKSIASNLEQHFYSPGEFVIKVGDHGDEMFIIHHGEVEVILEDGTIVANLSDGQFFGEIALLEETTRNANIRAKNYCDLYKLSKSDFLDIIKKFPELYKNMQSEIEARKNS